jgi:DNA repair exonuclease SbcCD ATPase subunit
MAATLAPASAVAPAFRLPPDRTDPPPPQQNTTDTAAPRHFDAGTEVTALSNKLIAAINYQTNLDDLLAAARQELDESKDTIRQLQATNKEHEELLANGTLVRRADVDQENAELRTSLEEERQRCAQIEKEKKAIEQELENLTTALFEEANQVSVCAPLREACL